MSDVEKIKPLSKVEITKLAIHYFAIMSKRKSQIIVVIVLAAFFKTLLKFRIDVSNFKIDKQDHVSGVKAIIFRASIFYALFQTSDLITEFIFEKQLAQYGGYIAGKVLEKVMFSDSKLAMDTQGSQFEYYMSEGGKALAKISKFIIFNLTSKLCYFVFDLYIILGQDKSSYKCVSITFMLLMFLLMGIKVYKMPKIVYYNKLNSDIAYEKEKAINETVESLAIIKTSDAKNHAIAKYARKAFLWEAANIGYKFWNLSTDMVFYSISTAARPGAALFYTLIYNPVGKSSVRNSDILDYMDKISGMLTSISSLASIQTDLIQTYALTENVIEYLKLAVEEVNKKIRVSTFSEAIEIKSLSYSVKDKLVFTNASFTLHRGDKVVLVGKNGTGKSSIFKILLGFDSYKGTILFDGVDFNQLCMTDYRKLISYVPQDTKLFDESIYYNLAYGNSKTFKEIVEECQSMGIHETIMSFPSGYNTGVGEGGKNINGGLKQKIFYTRAFLREAEIYLFDEPTNNLDVNHSEFLLEYIRKEKYANRTFLVICHDEDIANEFPRKLRLEQGQIEEIQKI